jgi:hypothetical protein
LNFCGKKILGEEVKKQGESWSNQHFHGKDEQVEGVHWDGWATKPDGLSMDNFSRILLCFEGAVAKTGHAVSKQN